MYNEKQNVNVEIYSRKRKFKNFIKFEKISKYSTIIFKVFGSFFLFFLLKFIEISRIFYTIFIKFVIKNPIKASCNTKFCIFSFDQLFVVLQILNNPFVSTLVALYLIQFYFPQVLIMELKYIIVVIFFCLISFSAAEKFHKYHKEENVPIYVNKIGPYENPSVAYHYYSFPLCSPNKEDIQKQKQNLAKKLDGFEKQSSLYAIKFLSTNKNYLFCTFRFIIKIY